MESTTITMKGARTGIAAIALLLLLLAAALSACGSGEDALEVMNQVQVTQEAAGAAGAAGGSFAAATAVPAAPRQPQSTTAPAAAAPAPGSPGPATSKVQASLAAQNRIIVHTGDMLLVVDDVAGAVERVIDLAREYGGWVVSADRSSRHSGLVSIRVPAQSLPEVMQRLESLALDVKSRSLSSQDVTDEYVDSQSRLTSLRQTQEVLLELLARADEVEDALKVQQEITQLQLRIEELQGRINFLQETAAYSLLNVTLELSTVSMPVDVGPDGAFRVGQAIRFRATFQPPGGIEQFSFVWDFGDGSIVTGNSSAPKSDAPGSRVTSSVSHDYAEEGDYIAKITLNGAGEAGLAEGSDALVASVTQVPVIETFAGDDRVADEGDDVEYRGSFTRPEGLWDFQFRWDFGDGTPTATGNPDEGATRSQVVHSYADHRPQPYIATFTVSAMSDAGRVSGSDSFHVQVNESVGFAVGNWDLGGTGKTAVRALSAVGRGLLTAIIWLGVFSPVWLIIGGILVYTRRRRARNPGDPRPSFPGLRREHSASQTDAQELDQSLDPTVRE